MTIESGKGVAQRAIRSAEILKGAAKTAAGIASGNAIAVAQGAAQMLPGKVVAVVVALAVFFTMFPVLIIFSIPQMLFSWATINDSELIMRNQHGSELYECYFNVIAEQEEGVEPDIYRLIAIESVLHKQKIEDISEAHVRESVRRSYSRNEDGSIYNKTPDEIMNELGFSDKEKNWANFMYSNLSDQYVDPESAAAAEIAWSGPEGDTSFNTEGSVLGNAGETQVVYYSQIDDTWKNTAYGRTGTIGSSGCGPTSLAIVVSTLTGQNVSPVDVGNWSVANGHRCEGSGSYHSLIPEGAKHYGLKVQKLGRSSSKELAKVLSSGKLVIVIMAEGHFTNNGHFIVLRGITEDGKVLVADPISRKRSNQEWDVSIILNEARGSASAGGPFWAVGL